MLLAELVAAADDVAATGSRTAKRDRLAELLRGLAPDEVEAAAGFLIGDVRQGRVGVGWATLASLPVATVDPATRPLDVLDVDRVLDRLAVTTGPGSMAARHELLADVFGRAGEREADFLRRLMIGELRQGALEGVMADAIAAAAGVPVASVRRAAMLSGDLRRAAATALRDGRDGLDAVGLTVLHPIEPMLASTSDSVASAMTGLVSVEWKLDGARVQVHRDGDDVRIFTRNLNDITERLPDVADLMRSLPATRFVLDGEMLGVLEDDRPGAFQDTMSRFGRDRSPATAAESDAELEHALETGALDGSSAGPRLRPFFFDVLHVDGQDLIDEPLSTRLEALGDVAHPFRIPGLVTADAEAAAAVLDEAIAAGHEGVMVKGIDSPYAAGRRGKAWRKVKPVRLFDLVVLAAEWGHGRRKGWLSNLHLGARDPASGSFVMVGKTFKGLTDALLQWQTDAFLTRELGRDDYTVHIRPDVVVEIALDGVQRSTRYPGGVALRFARVKRYRPDKSPEDADTIDALRALLPQRG